MFLVNRIFGNNRDFSRMFNYFVLFSRSYYRFSSFISMSYSKVYIMKMHISTVFKNIPPINIDQYFVENQDIDFNMDLEEYDIEPVSTEILLDSSLYINKNILRILSENLINIFVADIANILIKKNGQVHIFLKNSCLDVVYFLKKNCFFSLNQMLDFTIVDRSEMAIKKDRRFEYIYAFLSTSYNYRFFLRGFISMFESLRSLTSLYSSANWLEREVWDMFGIFIVDHPDLRRILTDYGFFGFPLRKDFPLSGYVELRYDEINKYVVAEPLELSQEFRYFKFEGPWKK